MSMLSGEDDRPHHCVDFHSAFVSWSKFPDLKFSTMSPQLPAFQTRMNRSASIVFKSSLPVEVRGSFAVSGVIVRLAMYEGLMARLPMACRLDGQRSWRKQPASMRVRSRCDGRPATKIQHRGLPTTCVQTPPTFHGAPRRTTSSSPQGKCWLWFVAHCAQGLAAGPCGMGCIVELRCLNTQVLRTARFGGSALNPRLELQNHSP